MTKKDMTILQRINPFYRIQNLKVRNKIIISFVFIIICIFVMMIFNMIMNLTIKENTGTIFFTELPVSQLASSCSKQLYKIRLISLQVLAENADFEKIYARFTAENSYLMKRVGEFNVLLGSTGNRTLQIQNVRVYNEQFRNSFVSLLFAYKDMLSTKKLIENGRADLLADYKKKLAQIEVLRQEADFKYDVLEKALVNIEVDYQDSVKKKIAAMQDLQAWFTRAALIISVIAIILGLTMAFMIFTSIITPLQALSVYVKKVANGIIPIMDMKKFNSRDEIGELASNFQNMCEGIKFIVSDIKESSNNISGAVKNSIKNFEQISEGTCNQSALLEEASGMVLELSQSIDNISRFINSSYDLSRETFESALHGDNAVKSTIQEIYEINNISKKSLQIVDGLGEASKRVNNITEMISNIADQTNMLALNAAIEAARAGDQGKGFAVVSDQVAKLAERSARSAKEIEELIENIQKEISRIAKVEERSSIQVEAGVKSAEVSGGALIRIIGNVEKVNKNIENISIISNHQVDLSSKINEAIQSVAATSEETAAGSENSYNQALSLGSIADKLQDIVKQFEIEAEEA